MEKAEDQVKVEAEIGIMLPQMKKCQELPESGGGKKGAFMRVFWGIMATASALILDFRLPEGWESNILLY